MTNHYDAIIIGAGMSGLAAGIRLAMFDKKVLILEKHVIAGGLNSFYQRRNKELGGVRLFDVGLHALTNFAKKGERKKPLTKLLKQLRISYDELQLHEQSHSLIHFPDTILKFNNDFEVLKNEIEINFPRQVDGFFKLLEKINSFDELNLNQGYSPSKSVLEKYITDPLLIEMLLCPLLIYGSAWENDMDFAQFVIMFKSLYMEGFSRPENGVRTVIDLLTNKYESVGGELNYREGVESIITKNGKVIGIKTKKNEYTANQIFSSAGLPETISLCDGADSLKTPAVGNMSFMESIIITDKKIKTSDFDSTIVFYNDSSKYHYKKSDGLFDSRSAVFCCPDNYELDNREGEGTLRVTFMANYEKWKNLAKTEYKEKKELVNIESMNLIKKLIPNFDYEVRFTDVFSPTTVERYTSHFNGTVYGSTDKSRDGKTPIENLYIIGTDQGFLGIVGSMLSGISIANLYGLMETK
jgi:phytoene dehydrogenase-like protein